MQLSKKQKSFSQFFSAFLEFRLNCEHLKKKKTLTDYGFLILQAAKEVFEQMSKNFSFRRSFDKRHSDWSQTLLKSEEQHLYHIY